MLERCLAFCVPAILGLILFPAVDSTYAPPVAYQREGDVVIGGLFPLHYTAERPDNYSLESQPSLLECRRYNFLGFRWMQAMIFAIEVINNSTDLLPDVTLGWEIYDTCNTQGRAVTQTLSMMQNYMGNSTASSDSLPVSAVIGPTESDKSIVVSNILSVFDVTQISYASTSRLLSNKNIYSSFFRTIPNDDEQALAIVELLVYNNWTWIGAVAGDDDYGRPGIARLREEAAKRDICVEYTAYVSKSMSTDQLRKVAQEIKNFNATVFVLFISATHLVPLSEQLSALNVTDKVWIASEAWATSSTIQQQPGADKVFKGTLGIGTKGGSMPGFRSFLETVSPHSQSSSPFLKEFWENSFHCHCPSSVCSHSGEHDTWHDKAEPESNCSGREDLNQALAGTAYLDWQDDDLEKTYNVYLAVYVIAEALQKIVDCKDGEGLLKDGKCPKIATLQPWQLLAYMKNVRFYPPGGNLLFTFDQNGDPNASYKLVSWGLKPNLTASKKTEYRFDLRSVGNYSTITVPRWSIDSENVYWSNNQSSPPTSICNTPCLPGFYAVQLPSVCCFNCLPCPHGEFSVDVGSPRCMSCNETLRPNANRTGCIPRRESYVRWHDGFGITFSCLSVLGILVTLFTCGAFFHKRQTPLVKATNRELSFFLFFAITCCFLTPFFYVAKPENWSCQARSVSFSLSFTLCISAILVKTLRVLTVFNAKVPVSYNKSAKFLGEHVQFIAVIAISAIQIIFCIAWLLVDPPFVTKVPNKGSFDTLTLECNMGSIPLVGCVYAYLCFLAIVAFVMAFRSRKLPENFNEAKFITFAMLIFFIVWLSFIPAYMTTTGTMSTAVYCIAILASTFGLLGCIFFHKLYVIFVTPNRNTIQEVRNNTVNHAMRSTRSVLYNVNATTTTGTDSPRLSDGNIRSSNSSGLRCYTGVQKQKAGPRSSIPDSKRLRWRKSFEMEKKIDDDEKVSAKSGSDVSKSSVEVKRVRFPSDSVSQNGTPVIKHCNENGNSPSSATIRVGIEGTISSNSSSESNSQATKTLNCDDSPVSSSFEVQVDVKVNILPTSGIATFTNDQPPPKYEARAQQSGYVFPHDVARETDRRSRFSNSEPSNREDTYDVINASSNQTKTVRSTSSTSLLSPVSTSSSMSSVADVAECAFIKQGVSLKETAIA